MFLKKEFFSTTNLLTFLFNDLLSPYEDSLEIILSFKIILDKEKCPGNLLWFSGHIKNKRSFALGIYESSRTLW